MPTIQSHETPSIQTIDLRRIYSSRNSSRPSITALAGVSLSIARGEIFGLLGRNGAGKTTLIKILTTLLAPTSGKAFVDGMDITTSILPVRQRIAMLSGGEQSGYGILTVREQLWMFAQFYGVPSKVAHKRIDELLAAVDLSEQANQKVYDLSTGMRQRMNLCRALVSDPEILWERPTGNLELYLMVPASMLWILAGMALGAMVPTIVRVLVILVVGSLLSGWMEKVALVVPLTYWVELVRRALLGGAVGASFPVASTISIMGLLVLTTVITMVMCVWGFRVCDWIARERGQIDRTTNY